MVLAKAQRLGIWILAGTVAAWGLAAAGEPSGAPLPASAPTSAVTSASAASGPAATAASTRAAGKGADDEESFPKTLIQAACNSFVIVEVWYKKDLSESAAVVERDFNISHIYDEYVDKKRPEERDGLVLDDKGHVLITDDGLEDRFLEKITVRDAAGNRYAATRCTLLSDAPGVLLEVEAKAIGKLQPLKFAEFKDRGADTRLLQGRLYQVDDQWRVTESSVSPAVGFSTGEPNDVYFGYRSSDTSSRRYSGRSAPTIIADANGNPLGCALASFMDIHQNEVLWKGSDLLRAKGLSWEEYQKAEQTQRQALMKAAQEVVITFRAGEESGRHIRGSAAGQEVSVYGIAISSTEILIERSLDINTAGQIDRIDVKFSQSSRAEAQFVGAYKKFGALVVKLKTGQLPAFVHLSDADLPAMKPFWEARIRKRSGEKYVDLIPNRIYGKARGYEGRYSCYAAREMLDGAMLVDFQGRLAGVYVPYRIENEEEHKLETSNHSQRAEARIFMMSELRDALARPGEFLDPKIIVKTRTESKRRAWFGVEYVPVTTDLAEQFKAEEPTKDGQMGFVVDAVYTGSPAQKAGIEVGDILLKLQAPGMEYPIELGSQLARGDDASFRGRFGLGEEEEDGGPPEQSWRSRSNVLTRALDAVGVGKKVQITYWRRKPDGKGELKTLDYVIEQAPRDVESAPRWQNRKLGLTVKDLTYEVRYALNLKDDAPGVLVTKVEDGSPMIIARVFHNEIITRVDDKPLHSARQMHDLIAQSRKAGKEKVRLTVLRLGKTRFADLNITEYDPADDEGLDEQ